MIDLGPKRLTDDPSLLQCAATADASVIQSSKAMESIFASEAETWHNIASVVLKHQLIQDKKTILIHGKESLNAEVRAKELKIAALEEHVKQLESENNKLRGAEKRTLVLEANLETLRKENFGLSNELAKAQKTIRELYKTAHKREEKTSQIRSRSQQRDAALPGILAPPGLWKEPSPTKIRAPLRVAAPVMPRSRSANTGKSTTPRSEDQSVDVVLPETSNVISSEEAPPVAKPTAVGKRVAKGKASSTTKPATAKNADTKRPVRPIRGQRGRD